MNPLTSTEGGDDVVIPEVLAPRIVHADFVCTVIGAVKHNAPVQVLRGCGTIGWYDGAPPWLALKSLTETLRVRFTNLERVDAITVTLARRRS